MRILVTGAAGFIGANLVRHLLATSDDHVTGFDALTYSGTYENLRELEADPRFTFVQGDVCDRAAVAAAIAGHDAVMHLAAETHVDRSLLGPDVFVHTNCTGTNVVCDEARAAGVARLLHVSTDEVYGSIEEGAFAEGAPVAPSSPYAASKAGSDLIALAHHTSHGLPVVVARSCNQYGPRQFPEKLIPFFVTRALAGQELPVYGDGLHRRDWMHVRDDCAALDVLLRHGAIGEIYNVAAHQERTNLQVTEAILACLGASPDLVAHVADRPGHDRRYAVDASKAAALGIAPTTSFEDGIEETVRWYVDHQDWWQPLVARVRNR